MSAVTDTAPGTRAPQPRGGLSQSVTDSLVIAKRNLIRMARIPNPVGTASLSCSSPPQRPDQQETS